MPQMKTFLVPTFTTPEKKILLKSFEDQMFGCTCQHLDTGHRLCEGKCFYDGCECEQFTPISLQISCTITSGDLFETENPNHSPKDSTNYWNEFYSWLLRRKK